MTDPSPEQVVEQLREGAAEAAECCAANGEHDVCEYCFDVLWRETAADTISSLIEERDAARVEAENQKGYSVMYLDREMQLKAEIERLCAYADGETDKLRDALRKLDEQDAEAEALRKALREIAGWAERERVPEDEKNAEYWEWGNYDDCYRYGKDVGLDDAKTEVASLLAAASLPTPEQETP